MPCEKNGRCCVGPAAHRQVYAMQQPDWDLDRVEPGKLEGLCMGLPKSHDTVCTSNKQMTKTLTGGHIQFPGYPPPTPSLFEPVPA